MVNHDMAQYMNDLQDAIKFKLDYLDFFSELIKLGTRARS